MKKNGAYLFIAIVFLFKVFDSLYLRPHSDAMNYHMYAPLNWAKYGPLYFNVFQSGHYQGALFEWVLTLFFKIWYPEDVVQREAVFILVQGLSCFLAFFVIPFVLFRTFCKRENAKFAFLLVCVYYGCEYLSWSGQYAKNDMWACGAFLLGVLSASPWMQALGLGIAVGIKPTYVFGVFTYLLIVAIKEKRIVAVLPRAVVSAFFFTLVLARNYLATGNPVYPQPSSWGLQPSTYRHDYFLRFSGQSDVAQVLEKFVTLFRYNPAIVLLLAVAIVVAVQELVKHSMTREDYFMLAVVALPLPTLFLTGADLEWRTFCGVVYTSLVFLALFLERKGLFKSVALYVVMCASFLATSKIDPSSFLRWRENHDKTFWQMNAKGATYRRVNETLEAKDILLNYDYSEGFFLKPQMYTVNEHPEFEKITSRYPELKDVNHFIGVHTNGLCYGTLLNMNFVYKLLEKSSQDLTQDQEAPNLYFLNIDC